MRRMAVLLFGSLLAATTYAGEDAATTVALINERLSDDPFYATDGYTIAMPSACIVELIPHGSRFGSAHRQRIALHVLDRSAAERVDWSDNARMTSFTTVHLVGRSERSAKRKGFPSTPELNEKGFPKDAEAMLNYGIELRLGNRNSARDISRAFVHLATLCVEE